MSYTNNSLTDNKSLQRRQDLHLFITSHDMNISTDKSGAGHLPLNKSLNKS